MRGGPTSTASPTSTTTSSPTPEIQGGRHRPHERTANQVWGSLGVGGTYTWNDGAYDDLTARGWLKSSLSELRPEALANSATAGFRIAW